MTPVALPQSQDDRKTVTGKIATFMEVSVLRIQAELDHLEEWLKLTP